MSQLNRAQDVIKILHQIGQCCCQLISKCTQFQCVITTLKLSRRKQDFEEDRWLDRRGCSLFNHNTADQIDTLSKCACDISSCVKAYRKSSNRSSRPVGFKSSKEGEERGAVQDSLLVFCYITCTGSTSQCVRLYFGFKSLYRKFLIDWMGFIGLLNLTNNIIHLWSFMDRFKIFPCVPVYGDFKSYGCAIMRMLIKFFAW